MSRQSGFSLVLVVLILASVLLGFFALVKIKPHGSLPFKVTQKAGEKIFWEKGASFPTSRPGNILVDSTGILHAFVFEPTNVEENDSQGRLAHYWFPGSASGDIVNYEEEEIVGAEDGVETVNIRVGADINTDDTMAIGFGLTTFNPLYDGHSEHLYLKKPQEKEWKHLIAGENLGHDFYYPFIVASNSKYYMLAVQDDYTNDGNPKTYDNIYQKIMYFEYKDGAWEREILVDLTDHEMASERPRLLEQSDLFVDSRKTVHVLYKEFLSSQEDWWTTSSIWHLVKGDDGWSKTRADAGNEDLNWVKVVEVSGDLYYLGTSRSEVYISRVGSGEWEKLDIGGGVKSIYPYLTGRSGEAKHIDVLLLGADRMEYEQPAHYYARIPKSEFIKTEK
mgnify:CR=1 FL=1